MERVFGLLVVAPRVGAVALQVCVAALQVRVVLARAARLWTSR